LEDLKEIENNVFQNYDKSVLNEKSGKAGMKEKRYCFRCNKKLETKNVDGIPATVCMKCRITTPGYKKEEVYFVKELQKYLNENEYYLIDGIVYILREYLEKIREVGK
jgi:hypothetical protein